ANEYMGIRGFFEEGYDGKSLIGTYFNGIYEVPKDIKKSHYKGISDKLHYMVNATNFLYTRIYVNGKLYEFNPQKISNFKRELDLKSGLYRRSYQIENLLEIEFERLLDMKNYQVSHQIIRLKPINYHGHVDIELGLDMGVKHWGQQGFWEVIDQNNRFIYGQTTTNQKLMTLYKLKTNTVCNSTFNYKNKQNIERNSFELSKEISIEKTIINVIDKDYSQTTDELFNKAQELVNKSSFENSLNNNQQFYQSFWQHNDIQIDGDELNQQGIRFCLFQLVQTYQGLDGNNNIGAK